MRPEKGKSRGIRVRGGHVAIGEGGDMDEGCREDDVGADRGTCAVTPLEICRIEARGCVSTKARWEELEIRLCAGL